MKTRLKKIKRINAGRFSQLTAAQKRVAIAKDVLIRLKAGVIEELHGSYLVAADPTLTRKAEETAELDELSGQVFIENNKCQVCAKGALVLSMVANFNKASVKKIWQADHVPGLSRIFPTKMRDDMEEAFERRRISLKKIMEDIVENKGSFTLLKKWYDECGWSGY